MSRTLFAAGRIDHQGVALSIRSPWRYATYPCANLDCPEPEDAITVELRWEPGIGEIGLLSGWTAGDVIAHCGCVLAEHEVAALAAKAEEESNG
jgi:hypothetical protein